MPEAAFTPERWHRIKSILLSVLERPQNERASYLDAECAGDDSLREDVQSLIQAHERSDSLSREPTLLAPPIHVGSKVAQYQLVSLAGRGGMGEVYLARDTVLGRNVAVKLLLPEFGACRERIERFQREARLASALSHPNIITIYEVGEHMGAPYIVTEFVEGVTLRNRISEGFPNLTEVLDIVIQVAAGLSAAHGAGVIHRDIKPENVMVRRDGIVKVLDFGLAKLKPVSEADRKATGNLTAAGALMGTPQYMSPEQALATGVDARSDLFSLGAVIYEMAAGQQPFQGGSAVEVLSRILECSPPALAKLRSGVPPSLSHLTHKALSKEPSQRFQSAAEMEAELRSIRRGMEDVRHPGGWRAPSARWALAGVAILLAAGLGVWMFFRKGIYNEPRLQLLHTFPLTSQQGYESSPAISPDGTAIAFEWTEQSGQPSQIWVRRLAEPSPVRLSVNEGGLVSSPTWSSDGQRIFFKRVNPTGLGGIMSVASTGGNESRLANLLVGDPTSALDASPDGRWLAYGDRAGPTSPAAIMILNLQTGERRQITNPPDGHWGDWDPKFSPDGKMLAFKRVKGLWQDSLYLLPLKGGAPRQLTFDGQGIAGHAWLPGGRSLLAACQRGGTIYGLWRIPVEPSGPPVLINQGGYNLLEPATAARASTIAWVNQLFDEDIYRVSTSGDSAPVRFITSTRVDTQPRWAPDGRIAFVSDRAGSLDIWLAQRDGSAQTQVTNFRRGYTGPPNWSADGRRLLTSAYSDGRVATLQCEPPGLICGQPKLVPRVLPTEIDPSWSNDGKFIYFAVNEGIWREPADGGQPVQITRNGGLRQQESPDGHWLYYSKPLSGVWRTRLPVPATGADEEEKVVHLPEYVPIWALGTTEIFFFKSKSASEPAGIFACNIATRKIRRITSAGEVRSISVSKDQQLLLFSQLDHSGSNVLVANAGNGPTKAR